MSTKSNKKQVNEAIGVLRTLLSLPQTNNTLNRLLSFTNKKNKDVFTFLVELLISVVGVEVLLDIIAKFLSSNLSAFEKSIKSSLKNQILGSLPQNSNQSNSLKNGIDIPIESIDVFNNQKVDPNTIEGKAVYGAQDSFERFLKKVLITPGQQYGYPANNPIVFYTFNQTTNKLNIKSSSSLNYTQFINSFIDSMVLFDRVIIVGAVYDLLFGVITKQLKKSGQQIELETKIMNIIEKISENQEEDNYFKFDIEESTKLNIDSENKKDGIMQVNACCSTLNTEYNINDLDNILNQLSITSSETQIANTISDSANNITSPDETIDSEDRASVKNNFLKEFLNALKKAIINSIVLSPQIRILQTINNITQNGVANNSVIDDIKKNKSFIQCIIGSLMKQMNELLFNLLKKELLKIARGISALYAKEAAEKARIIAKSLIRLK